MEGTQNSYIVIEPFELKQLQELKIEKRMNEHVRLTLKGIVPESRKDSYVQMADAQTEIVVKEVDGEGKRVTLFHGMILDVEVQMVNGVYSISARAVSSTYKLDVKPVDRSFQQIGLAYRSVMNQVVDAYPQADFIDYASNGSSLESMILQYRESDWQLLKRLASHFYTGVVPAAMDGRILCYIGLPRLGGKGKLTVHNYRVKKRMDLYQRALRARIPGVSQHDFVFYEVESPQVLDLGHEVEFAGKKLLVSEVGMLLEQGELKRRYTLAREGGLVVPKQYNSTIVGASVQGKVLAVSKDTVKVHLNMDASQDEGGACWLPYSTIYASADNAGWYFMPEQGDQVRVYFPTHEEKDAFATSSVAKAGGTPGSGPAGRGAGEAAGSGAGAGASGGGSGGSAGSGGDPMQDPEIKTLKTKNGKVIVLAPDYIMISGNGVSILLEDENGITLTSSKDIKVTATENVILQSKNITLAASEKVEMSCKDSSLVIENDVVLKGNQVRNN
ncbi:phage baseplate assembly protein V [Paenibacillus sp. A14]|uniref:phage baseplate assembly protein V n=1 Tax=Paenibacillus sp. A14 TaxID=3119820 RepID=UPI002FE121D3